MDKTSNHWLNSYKVQVIMDFSLKLEELRDPQLASHSMRVASMASVVAKKLGKDDYACWVAGTLHDIGKIFLPLNLFDGHDISISEFEQIKHHAVLSYNILKDDLLFTSLVCGLHHALTENGYGLSVEDFPETIGVETLQKVFDVANIISVCDFADAFLTRTTKLRDSNAKTLKEALNEKFPNSRDVVSEVLRYVGEYKL